jgi:hypothetical protein
VCSGGGGEKVRRVRVLTLRICVAMLFCFGLCTSCSRLWFPRNLRALVCAQLESTMTFCKAKALQGNHMSEEEVGGMTFAGALDRGVACRV